MAFAEQVEAYERKLCEEHDVSREQTKLHERSARLSGTESADPAARAEAPGRRAARS